MGGVSKTDKDKLRNYEPTSYLEGNTNSRRYKPVIDPLIYRELETMSGQHSGVLVLAHKLADLFSEAIVENGVPIIDLILLDATTAWVQLFRTQGVSAAYKAYCRVLLKKLPLALELRVSGVKASHPHTETVWDPLKEPIVQWMNANKPQNLRVERVKNDTIFSERELGLMMATNFFTREDLVLFGFGDLYVQEVIAVMDVQRHSKLFEPAPQLTRYKKGETE